MKTIESELNRKKDILNRLMKEQDKRKDLSYKTDKELKIINEIKELKQKLKEQK